MTTRKEINPLAWDCSKELIDDLGYLQSIITMNTTCYSRPCYDIQVALFHRRELQTAIFQQSLESDLLDSTIQTLWSLRFHVQATARERISQLTISDAINLPDEVEPGYVHHT